jgi:metallophosphoesterase (TIGR03768 family)
MNTKTFNLKSLLTIRNIVLFFIILILIIIFVINLKNNNTQQTSYPIDSNIYTTIERTIVPVAVPSTSPKILPYEVSKYSQYGYGNWNFDNGIAFEKRLDLMPSTYINTSTSIAKLLNFFTITDIHITDKESPAEGIFMGYKGGTISAYSPTMMYTTQVLDAVVQTINSINKKTPLDFGISLGDDTNSNQYNELRWFIDTLDGKKINPDSGTKDDPVPGPLNDYQDEFKAAGLDKSIPWYQTLGNHDHFWMGVNALNDYLKPFYTGNNMLNLGNIFTEGMNSRGSYVGAVDGKTPYGNIVGAGPVANFSTPPQVPADNNRRPTTKTEWINEFLNTTSLPMGHGFSQSNASTGFACYTFEPKSNLPIKIIVLDDTQDDTPGNSAYGRGFLNEERYNWLVSELDKGQAEGKLMIIAAHIPIGVEKLNSFIGWTSASFISDQKLITKLNEYSNILMWISGHRHLNTITALKSPDTNHPELGFWEVETSSLREFPQQFRTFEIVRNNDNTISIFTTNIDPAFKAGSLAAISRSYAIGANQMFNLPTNPSYNAELVKQLSLEMQIKIQAYGTPIVK